MLGSLHLTRSSLWNLGSELSQSTCHHSEEALACMHMFHPCGSSLRLFTLSSVTFKRKMPNPIRPRTERSSSKGTACENLPGRSSLSADLQFAPSRGAFTALYYASLYGKGGAEEPAEGSRINGVAVAAPMIAISAQCEINTLLLGLTCLTFSFSPAPFPSRARRESVGLLCRQVTAGCSGKGECVRRSTS